MLSGKTATRGSLRGAGIKTRVTKDTHVFHILRERILGAQLRPGQRLIEEDLSAELALTRTPIRQALRRLEHEGLVVSEPFCGCRVRKIEPEEVAPLYEVREALEGLAAQLAAVHATEETLAALRRRAHEVDEFAFAGQWYDYYARDHLLHGEIMRAAGNPVLIETGEVTRFHSHAFASYSSIMERIIEHWERVGHRNAARHQDLLAAISSRDPEAAERTMREHVRSAKAIILACLDGVG